MKSRFHSRFVPPVRLGWLVVVVALGFGATSAVGDELQLYAAEVSRIEAQIDEDYYAATQAARALRHQLEEQLIFERSFQIDQQDRAESWSRLAESTLDSAIDAEDNATRWLALAEDKSLGEDDRQTRRGWADAEQDAARRLRMQAQDMAARSEEFVAQAAEMEPLVSGLVALIDRLDIVLGRERQSPQLLALDGDEVPIRWEYSFSAHYDERGYVTGWDIAGSQSRIESGGTLWEGDGSFIPGALVYEEGQPVRFGIQEIVQFFRNLVPSIVEQHDRGALMYGLTDAMEHSAGGPEFFEYLGEFSEATANTLEHFLIHRDQFESFLEKFEPEFRRIFSYRLLVLERLARRVRCESIATSPLEGIREEYRHQFCGNNRVLRLENVQAQGFLQGNWSEVYWALGVNPWTYMEEIAQNSRPAPLLPVCVEGLRHPPVSALIADFQAELEAAEVESREFWEEANRHYREEWLPVRLSFDFEDADEMP